MTFLVINGTKHWLSILNLLKKILKRKDISALTILLVIGNFWIKEEPYTI